MAYRLSDLEPENAPSLYSQIWVSVFPLGKDSLISELPDASRETPRSDSVIVIAQDHARHTSRLSVDLRAVLVDEKGGTFSDRPKPTLEVSSEFLTSRLKGPSAVWPKGYYPTTLSTNPALEQLRDLLQSQESFEREAIEPYLSGLSPQRVFYKSFVTLSNYSALRKFSGFFDDITLLLGEEHQLDNLGLSGEILLATARGVPVVPATNDGIVVYADRLGVMGKTVIINHGWGISSVYGSLDMIQVKEGDRVSKLEAIGIPGTSSIIAEPGVFYQLRLGGQVVNSRFFEIKDGFFKYYTRLLKELKRLEGSNPDQQG
jgi:hypothetical protein